MLAFAYFSSSAQLLSIAIYVLLGSSPFSNLLDASLLNIFLDVFLIFTLSNIADSIIIFLVLSSTSVESPPITPANPTASFSVEITISFSSNCLFIPSNVINSSFLLAFLTINFPPNLSES